MSPPSDLTLATVPAATVDDVGGRAFVAARDGYVVIANVASAGGVSVVAPDGARRTLDQKLPVVDERLVAAAGNGFAIVGARCTKRGDPADEDNCLASGLYVSFLDDEGKVRGDPVGFSVPGDQRGFDLQPTPTGVLVAVLTTTTGPVDWLFATAAGDAVRPVDLPPEVGLPCPMADGTLLGVRTRYPGPDNSVSGQVPRPEFKVMRQTGDSWLPIGPTLNYPRPDVQTNPWCERHGYLSAELLIDESGQATTYPALADVKRSIIADFDDEGDAIVVDHVDVTKYSPAPSGTDNPVHVATLEGPAYSRFYTALDIERNVLVAVDTRGLSVQRIPL